MSALDIWMNGERVGVWTRSRGSDSLSYEPSWIESEHGRPLSLSLPFTADRRIVGEAVANYFDNLLPDARSIRARIAQRFRVKATDAFDLLAAIGRDCVGAVQLLPPGRVPEDVFTLRYDEHLDGHPSGRRHSPRQGRTPARISRAGVGAHHHRLGAREPGLPGRGRRQLWP